MLLPQPHKKSKKAEATLPLNTTEQADGSLREEHALGIRALRKQEEHKARSQEIENEWTEFELTREKVYLALELIAIIVLLALAVISCLSGESKLAFGVLGGGLGLGGLIAVLHRPSKPDPPS